MLVLGIDPGTAICGYGLVDMTGNRLRPVFYGSVLTDKDMLPELRLNPVLVMSPMWMYLELVPPLSAIPPPVAGAV